MNAIRIASLISALCLGLMHGLMFGGGTYAVAVLLPAVSAALIVAVLFSATGAVLMVAVCVAAGSE